LRKHNNIYFTIGAQNFYYNIFKSFILAEYITLKAMQKYSQEYTSQNFGFTFLCHFCNILIVFLQHTLIVKAIFKYFLVRRGKNKKNI